MKNDSDKKARLSTDFVARSDVNRFPAFKDNNIAIFFACDDKFLPYTMTAIALIMENGSRENNYDIIVIGKELEEGKRSRAIEWMGRYPNGRLRFLDAADCLNLSGMANFYVTKTYPLKAVITGGTSRQPRSFRWSKRNCAEKRQPPQNFPGSPICRFICCGAASRISSPPPPAKSD